MDRRDFLWGLGLAGATAMLPTERSSAQSVGPLATESRKAYGDLLDRKSVV